MRQRRPELQRETTNSLPGEARPRTKQPNSRHCFVCGVHNAYGLGLRFYETGAGQVVAEYAVPERYQGFPGVVHGGVVAAMLDEAAGRAAMTGEEGRFMVTAKLEVSYRQPVRVGESLLLTGALVRRRGRLASANAQIALADGTIAASAVVLLADLPGTPANAAQLEALGWKVYAD
jgi:uncharacterized protein (TIGR00369 family)